VLIYPYFTVNAGFGTLLSVVNTTNAGKALKVHVREGYDGRGVFDFNVYLSPFDVWVAQIFSTSAGASGPAAIATNDNSCTVPPLPAAGEAFSTLAFDGSVASQPKDGGPTSPSRTREGYIEIIEMGEVTNAQRSSLDAIVHDPNGAPGSCAQLVSAWSVGGYWSTNPQIDMAPPGGGLYGAESIINVDEGLIYAVNAVAVDAFSSTIQHGLPGDSLPDLSSAGKDANGIVSAFVPIASGMVRADFTHGEDAFSALFMADKLYNEYVVDAALNAATDWIVTSPTKRFYTDPALATQARAPFDAIFGADATEPGSSCSGISGDPIDREERTIAEGTGFGELHIPNMALCYSTSVVTFGTPTSALGSLRVVNDTEFTSVVATSDVGFTAGHLQLDFTTDSYERPQTNHVLTSTNGLLFQGLPAIGFAATEYVNGNVTPGTLANYSSVYPHRSSVACRTGSNPAVACVPASQP
jgi:hypothetical protein